MVEKPNELKEELSSWAKKYGRWNDWVRDNCFLRELKWKRNLNTPVKFRQRMENIDVSECEGLGKRITL
jgi:hypothetical protein